jgi:hypothetical protein
VITASKPWLILEKIKIHSTPTTISAVPWTSCFVTSIPTRSLAKIKLKTSEVEPSGATQSLRRYFRERVDPTGRGGQRGVVCGGED